MFASILARLFAGLVKRWQRVLLVQLLVLVCVSLVVGFFALVATGYGDVPAMFAVALVGLSIASQFGANWLQVAGVRAASGRSRVFESAFSTIGGSLRLLVFSILLALAQAGLVLIHPVLLLPWLVLAIVPLCIAVGAVALDPPSWGIRTAWELGVRRIGRNAGAYAGALLGAVLILALAGALFVGPVLGLSGGLPSGTGQAALEEWAADAMLGLVVGGMLAGILFMVAWPILVYAVYSAVSDRIDLFADEEVEATKVEHELSPVVAELLGAAAGPGAPPPSGAPRRRRLHVPPRAQQAGRLPSPGVLSVTDVTLPPGATTRPVDAPTLELDVFDAAPGGGAVSPSLPSMWVSSQPVPNAPAAFRQLAAGFEESGLWPVLLPAADLAVREPWPEQRARRDRDSIDATAPELFQARLEGSLRDSPLASTDDIGASGVARGELGRGSGKRTDALDAAFQLVGSAHLGLVGVRRPGEVLHRTAWPGTEAAGITGIELAELVASWEERYGALLVGLGAAQLTFAVLRPPMSLEEAIEVAAEHHATCPDECDAWGDDRTYAASLIDTPTWQVSWT